MTYSIIARDTKTWNLWVAVQTHWFGVGNNVPWLQSGVWAIATQAQTNMDYGKKWLVLLEERKTPQEAFQEIAKTDEALHARQVAMIDVYGNTFAHTWQGCLKYADYIMWDNFVVQGNILTNRDVLPAMKEVYEKNIHLDFAERLYLCIKAWEDAWWEVRWVQSASLRIVPWVKDTYDIIDLRVDDNEKPLQEMKRQLDIQKAYKILVQAEEVGFTWSIEESLTLFSQALKILPDNQEILFWKAFMLQYRWEIEEAEKIFRNFPANSTWHELRKRIS